MMVEICGNCSSMLCHAVKKGDLQLVQDCIKNTPAVDLKINYDSNDSCLPLLWQAALDGSLDVAKLLIRSGADINKKIVGAYETLCKRTHKSTYQINNSQDHELTLIEVFSRCRAGREERRRKDYRLIEYLIAHGATINSDYSVQKHSPLWHAMKNSNYGIAELLVIGGADLVGPEWNEEPSVIVALQSKEAKKFVSLFIEYGADATKIGLNGMNAMHYLSSNKNCAYCTDTAKMLVEQGVPFDEPNVDGASPLHLSTQHISHSWFFNYLIEKGANLHRRDKNGQTPLHYACKYSYGYFALKPLLEHGADIDVEDNKGKTPISLINNRHDSSSITELLKYIALMNRNKEKISSKKRKLNPEDLENEKNRLRIHEKNMSFIQSRYDFSRQYKDYVDELTRMEEIELGENFTYCDVLNWPYKRDELVAMIKEAGKDLLKMFEEINYETLFPCYKDDFTRIFQINNPSKMDLNDIFNNEVKNEAT